MEPAPTYQTCPTCGSRLAVRADGLMQPIDAEEVSELTIQLREVIEALRFERQHNREQQ